MKITLATPSRPQYSHAFSLVELLTVIAIIGILAYMVLTVMANMKKQARKVQAKIQVNDIANAIQAYDSAYRHFPVSSSVQTLAGTGDFTYGGAVFTSAIANGTLPASDSIYTANNSEVIAILMDIANYPSPHTTPPYGPTANLNHEKNSKQIDFLIAKLSGWEPGQSSPPAPGVGNDLVYRDPWGNPYIISLDLNYDGHCQDAFYGLDNVSQNPPGAFVPTGYNGLINQNLTPATQAQKDSFQFHGTVMVWSAGPDGKITSSAAAATDVNKDNILTWQ